MKCDIWKPALRECVCVCVCVCEWLLIQRQPNSKNFKLHRIFQSNMRIFKTIDCRLTLVYRESLRSQRNLLPLEQKAQITCHFCQILCWRIVWWFENECQVYQAYRFEQWYQIKQTHPSLLKLYKDIGEARAFSVIALKS